MLFTGGCFGAVSKDFIIALHSQVTCCFLFSRTFQKGEIRDNDNVSSSYVSKKSLDITVSSNVVVPATCTHNILQYVNVTECNVKLRCFVYTIIIIR